MRFFCIILLTIIASLQLSAQDFTSKDNTTGDWKSGDMWVEESAPSNTGEAGNSVAIYGKITLDDELILDNENLAIIYDTLWVKADIYINNGSNLEVQENAVLIVNGKLVVEEGGTFYNNGLTVIQDSYDIRKGSFVSETKIYIYNNGPFNPGTDPIKFSGGIGNETNFINDYPDLYNQIATGTLPIKLLSFTGTVQNKSVQLDWTTAWEENFDFFTVERASEDLNFEAIGTVQGTGNTSAEVTYAFTDKNPLQGQAFYRLKATDYDGSVEYHQIINVHFNGFAARTNTATVYPNPVTNHSLKVETADTAVEEIRLMDLGGRTLFRQAAQEGINEISLPHTVNPGSYLIIVQSSNGQQEQKKIMIL